MPQEVLDDPKRWVESLECDVDPPVSPCALKEAMEGRTVLLELGCAVGNGVLPLLRANRELFAIACDIAGSDCLIEREARVSLWPLPRFSMRCRSWPERAAHRRAFTSGGHGATISCELCDAALRDERHRS